jgi:hypothetical protein
MAKMTKAEREECERNLALCESAVQQFKKMLADDDESEKAASGSAFDDAVRKVARDHGTTAGFLAARMNPRRGGPQ